MRAATFLAMAVAVVLIAGGAALGVRERSQHRVALDAQLTNTADEDGSRLEAYFERARSIMLLTAHNPAFRDFYRVRGSRMAKLRARGPALRKAEAALGYLERLYRGSIGEACFIDHTGPENARYVDGFRAKLANLSPDESGNPFFHPTFALHAGQVFQAKPYVSPDTNEWVISNSTPVPGTGFPAAAIVHYEIRLDSFRREAAAVAGKFEIAIVDAQTGAVVIDSRRPQWIGAPLGAPGDHRFRSLAGSGGAEGTATVSGHRIAYQGLRHTAHNENRWLVVAVDPHPAGAFLDGFGSAPLGMALAGLLLFLLAGISFRSSRRTLHAAAHTDALTGLGNRRQLLIDLEQACNRASESERVALVLFDLDGFKNYNDSFGHLPGDALLRRLGQKLASAVAGWGTAYRLGGDEFCVLAPLRGREPADGLAALGAEALHEEGEGFAIGASYGTVLLPDEARSATDLLATADLRMYAAKQNGRPSTARQTTDALVRAQQECSELLGPHVSEVAALAELIALRLELPEQRVHRVRQAAELHDVGKMAIPDDVLDKPAPLSKDEQRLLREHTIIGERIISAAPALQEVAKLVRSTHEHFDGSGYPDRLAGTQIPLESRIVHAADAYCAMTQHRPYRAGMSTEDALDELGRCAGRQFDPDVVDAAVAVVRERDTFESSAGAFLTGRAALASPRRAATSA